MTANTENLPLAAEPSAYQGPVMGVGSGALLGVPGPVGQLCLPVMIGGTRAGTNNWTWNGSVEAPTLRPSVLTWNEREGLRCHSWINDGHAQFLDDTTHELRGQTVPLLPLANKADMHSGRE